jgi:hypothetical protein
MGEELKKYTCKFSPKNEYVQRMLNADNGLWDAMWSLKNGDASKYKKYYSKITNNKICEESVAEFWGREATTSQNIQETSPPLTMLHSNVFNSYISMNIDHSMLVEGDVFLIDGNHRTEAAMVRGEEPVVAFDHTRNISPEWKAVINAKSDPLHRIKHQPHPHPVLWDLKEYRTMESCQIRYGELAKSGIKNTYEIGCAEGVGIWILRQSGVQAYGSEINGPARTLAQSLIKDKIDSVITPKELPETECLILYSVLYHLINNKLYTNEWIEKIKQYQCVALELSTDEENEVKQRYRNMKEYRPLKWWPNRKLLYVDSNHANRETWLLWK